MIESILKGFEIWSDAQGVKSKGKVKGIDNISHEGIERLRQLVLTLAFSGKLDTQNSEDEPSIEILNRIKSNYEKKIVLTNNEENRNQIPDTWQWCQIGSIANHNTGKTLDSGRNKGIFREYITTSNLYWGYFKLEDLKSMAITEEEVERFTAEKGDLLICEGGDSGRSAVWEKDESICFQNHIHRVRLLEGINPYYLYYFMMKIHKSGEIQEYRKGIGISSISGKALSSIQLPLAPIEEQQRIIDRIEELFSICDKLEEQHTTNLTTHHHLVKTLLETLTNAADADELQTAWEKLAEHFNTLFCTDDSIEQLKQTILQLAIMGRLVKQNPNDEPASELIKQIELEKNKLLDEGKIRNIPTFSSVNDDEKIFELPASWKWVRLGSIGIGSTGKTPSTSIAKYFGGDIPFIGPGQISNNGLISDSDKTLTDEGAEYSTTAENGDILMVCIGGSIGKSAVVKTKVAFNQQLNCISPILVATDYLFNTFNSPYFFQNVLKKATGSATPIINRGKWEEIPIPIAPFSEQKRIVERVAELFTICDSISSRISKSQDVQTLLSQTVIEAIN